MFDRRRRVSSSSRSGGAVHELVHEWTITGYDFIKGYQIERFNSPPFQFYGFEWFIQFYPHGTTDNRDSVSQTLLHFSMRRWEKSSRHFKERPACHTIENVAIFLIGKELPKAEILCSYIQFSVVNQSDDAKTLRPRPYYYVLSGKDTKHNHSNSGGHINVIKSVDLHDTSRGFIGEDGTLRIRLELKISCLDPMLCPHARDPRTGECRMSASPDSSMMDVQDDSPAREAGLMPSLKSLLTNEVCTDVELRVVCADSCQRKLHGDADSVSSRRSSFTPFDTLQAVQAPSTPRSYSSLHGAAPSLSSRAAGSNAQSHSAPSAGSTRHHDSFNPLIYLLNYSGPNTPLVRQSLDTTLDEDEFSDLMMNDPVAPPHPSDPLPSVAGEFPPQPPQPPRAHTVPVPTGGSGHYAPPVLSPQRSRSDSLPPRTPSSNPVDSLAAHAGPTTPAALDDSPHRRNTSTTSPRLTRAAPRPLAGSGAQEPPATSEKTFYSRHAHKCILASRSPVFRAMFSLKMRESVSNVVEIEDMRPEILDALLAYIYSDKEPDLQLAPEMLVVADKYQMLGLLHTCECVLARALSIENCVSALVFADRYTFGCPHLRETTISFMCQHFQAVCRSEAFVALMRSHTPLAHEVVCEHARMATSVQ